MRTLLRLQELDLRIERCRAREAEIPMQKGKFDIHRARLVAELEEREALRRDLSIEQRACEGEIEQMQAQIAKYDQQLFAVKKNEEYQALLHEIDALKRKVGAKEERILTIMVAMDDASARLEEDRTRIDGELRDLDAQCAAIDAERLEAVRDREELQLERVPLREQAPAKLLAQYDRIRRNKKTGAVVVPLNDEVCSGCNMRIPAQIVNEVLEGNKTHACVHCGRILYEDGTVEDIPSAS